MRKKITLLVTLLNFGLILLVNGQSNCRNITVFFQRISASEFAVTINPSDVYTGNYSGIYRLSLSKTTFRWAPVSGIDEMGNHLDTLTITDSLGIQTTCQSVVTVLLPADPPPQANCKDITLELNAEGSANLSGTDIDNGSQSSAGIQSLFVDLGSFSCSDVGTIPVKLIVTDFNGNRDSCISMVTVEDTVKPVAKSKDVILSLDRNGLIHLVPSMIDDGSHDACGIHTMDVSPNFFNCSNIGSNTVTLTVTDNNNNSSTSTSTVYLEDRTPPEANCKNITAMLNSNGTVTITPSFVNNGSFDGCGLSISAFSLDRKEFSCIDAGQNKVILTVEDNTSNISSCTAIVTVVNQLYPDANCRNITLNLDKFGNGTIYPDELNNGSTAVCGIKDITIDKSEFTSADRGPDTVTMTVTDVTGISETCTSIITVIPHDSLVGRVFNSGNTPEFGTNNFPFLEIDGEDNVMAGSSGAGLYIYRNSNWESVFNQFGSSGFIVRSMRRNPSNNEIWIGMSKSNPCLGQVGGVYVYSQGNQIRRYVPPPPPTGISEGSTTLEMNSFLAQHGFSATLNASSTYMEFLDIYNSKLQSLVVRSMDFNKSTKDNWVGCSPQICQPGYNGGISRILFNGSGNNYADVYTKTAAAGLPPYKNGDMFITALASASDGTEYAGVGRSCLNGCLPAYILKMSSSGNVIAKYDNSNSPLPLSTSSTSLAVRAMLVDRQNRLWVGGELNGIGVLDENGWHFLQNPLIPYNNNTFVNFDAITQGEDGNIYFGTSNGLLVFIGGDVMDGRNWNMLYLKATNVSSQGSSMQNIGSIRFDSNNSMWIGTRGQGIFYVKNPVVYNLAVNRTKDGISKKPFKGIKVTAINEAPPYQETTPILTDDNGQFQSQLDLQLMGPNFVNASSFTLKFKYTRDPNDSLDRDFEFVFPSYSTDISMDDILMPVKLRKQTRELMEKIHPNPPNQPRKYDIKIFDYSLNDAMDLSTWDLSQVNVALDSWNEVNDETAPDVVQNIGRLYLSLYAHDALSYNAMDMVKILPKSILSMVTTIMSLAPALGDVRSSISPALSVHPTGNAQGTRDQTQELVESFEFAAGNLTDALNTVLDQLKSHFEGQPSMQNLCIDLKTYMADAGPVAIASIHSMRGLGNPKDIVKKVIDNLKGRITTVATIVLYELYIKQSQSMINDAARKLRLNFHPGGTFETAAVNTLQLVREMDTYTYNVNNLTDFFFANTASESIVAGAVTVTAETANAWNGEGSNLAVYNVVNHVGQTARSLITKFPLAKLISTGWDALNVIGAAEEGIRGCITIMDKQHDINDGVFNPTVATPSTPSSISPNFSRTTGASINNEIDIYNQQLNTIKQVVQNNQSNDARIAISNLASLDSAIRFILSDFSERYGSIADSADEALQGFSVTYNNFVKSRNNVSKLKSFLRIAFEAWSDDTSSENLNSFLETADSLASVNNTLKESFEEIENITTGFAMFSTATITSIAGPKIIESSSQNNLMVRYKNYGLHSADSVYLKCEASGGFTFANDSIFIGTVLPGDTGSVITVITAPAADTFASVQFSLQILNGGRDMDIFSISATGSCHTRLYADNDLDGFGDLLNYVFSCNQPINYVTDSTDCNDSNAHVHPGALELCNDLDENCNGVNDDGVKNYFYLDHDGDGYGNNRDSIFACSVPDGYVNNNSDCNDTVASVNPIISEICNGIDDNCSGAVDEGALLHFYRDFDGDGSGDPSVSISGCVPLDDYVADQSDCNDTRADIHPGMPELCNGVDDDCDGHIDPGCGTHTYFKDLDGDTFGSRLLTISTNSDVPPPGYVSDSTDCDDSRNLVHPGVPETCNGVDDNCNGQIDEGLLIIFFRDADGDSYGTSSVSIQACTQPAGYSSAGTDCNDADANVNPGVAEVPCNQIDDNCNLQTDEGALLTFYRDADNDGFGNPDSTAHSCFQPAGYVTNASDCNDANAGINPGATELCNLADDNCNGIADEGVKTTFYRDVDNDGFGDRFLTVQACTLPSGFVPDSTDCNDNFAAIHPGIAETCNGIDDNCNGTLDENVKLTFYRDADNDSFGNALDSIKACSVPSGYVADNSDCDDSSITIHPGASEICNGIDEDCNGQIDEDVKTTFYLDFDNDGYGDFNNKTLACTLPLGFVANNTDCNDGNDGIHPGATELCDSIDNNCNGSVDEGVQLTFYRDADRDGFGNPTITTMACSAPSGFVADNTDCNDGRAASNSGATELCNGADDNCNGAIDEGVKTLFYGDADGDGFGSPDVTNLACTAIAGYVANSGDCNDDSASVHPGATEVCNGIDDDCDGVTDSAGCDLDGDGFTLGQNDCNDLNPDVYPGAAEDCNDIDDNCNGLIDEGCVGATMNLRVFIQGLYSGNGLMYPVLFNSGLSNDPTACDSVTVVFHDSLSSEAIAFSIAALLRTDGHTTISLPFALSNHSYYLAIRHRNTIAIWSRETVLINSLIMNFDFTSP